MGDRAQIAVKSWSGTVYLYGHWSGGTYLTALQDALKRRIRWADSEYLTRIIFEHLVGDDRGTETGYGIGFCVHGDVEYPVMYVDTEKQTITAGTEGYGLRRMRGKSWTFEQFIAADLGEVAYDTDAEDDTEDNKDNDAADIDPETGADLMK